MANIGNEVQQEAEEEQLAAAGTDLAAYYKGGFLCLFGKQTIL